jgi:hypothetical protein
MLTQRVITQLKKRPRGMKQIRLTKEDTAAVLSATFGQIGDAAGRIVRDGLGDVLWGIPAKWFEERTELEYDDGEIVAI